MKKEKHESLKKVSIGEIAKENRKIKARRTIQNLFTIFKGVQREKAPFSNQIRAVFKECCIIARKKEENAIVRDS